MSDRCSRAAVGSVPAGGRRDPFAPLLENALAAMLRDPEGPGAAALAVPTDGAPRPVTRYADGRERINLGSGNYLGLAGDPRVTSAAAAALEQYGTSTAGSRVLNGTTGLHLALEEELADHYGTEAAVLTSSGVNANVALLSTVCSAGDVLLVDSHVHASLHAAAAASRGAVLRFRHNDLDDLTERLTGVDPRAGVVVVVDGVYSMTGELAPPGPDRRAVRPALRAAGRRRGPRAGCPRPRGARCGSTPRGAAPGRRGDHRAEQGARQRRRCRHDLACGRRGHPRLGDALRLQRCQRSRVGRRRARRAPGAAQRARAGHPAAGQLRGAAPGAHRERRCSAGRGGGGPGRADRGGRGHRAGLADRFRARRLHQRGHVSGGAARPGRAAPHRDGHAHGGAAAAGR
ncbi:MAG: aminotransferase class I/II-fold pyridoxal phosphate-dependent enzyme [Geodermatophilales bacterium]|nr:aminotransferase class I/II-fold pyridoxal phosphate-dependent enzyme [Geodermatophilales bacterium]